MITGIVASTPYGQPDGPTDWQPLDSGVFPGGAATNWVMLSSNNTDTLLLSGITAKFFRSVDSGGTWTALSLPAGESGYVRTCTWVSGTRWLAVGNATNNTAYYVSTDNGDSWTSKSYPYTPTTVTIFRVDSQDSTRVYALNGPSIYLSTDSGETFSATPLVTFSNSISGIVQNGSGSIVALINLNPVGQYSVSTNSGVSWGSQITLSSSYVYGAGVWNGTYWIMGAVNSAAPILYSATAGSGTWSTALADGDGAWSMQYNPVDGSTVSVGSAETTPISSRQSVTTWVSSPISGLTGTFLNVVAAGDYWVAAGGANIIRAPRAR